MTSFSVIDSTNIVVNLIEAESKEIAEQVTGLTCIQNTEENFGYIGLKIENGIFETPKLEEKVTTENSHLN
jgi:hypothetical protein